jgi:hypothetical protein
MTDLVSNAFNYSRIAYAITDTNFSVQWTNVTLWADAAPLYTFTFQVTIEPNGTITFFYFDIPKLPNQIEVQWLNTSLDVNYTLHFGLEDAAYNYEESGFYSVIPYAPVTFNESFIENMHTIVFQPRETCIDQSSCTECMEIGSDPGTDIECGWCSKANLCSDGKGREIFEYNSDDFCDANELQLHLTNPICTDLVSFVKECATTDHVLAKNVTRELSNGDSHFYSGVIIGVNADSNTYSVRFDDESIVAGEVQDVHYAWVHPCSVISYNFHSSELPSICFAHCKPIPEPIPAPSYVTKTNVALVILIIVCAFLVGFAVVHVCFKFCSRINRTRIRTFREYIPSSITNNNNANLSRGLNNNNNSSNMNTNNHRKDVIEMVNQHTKKGIRLADDVDESEFGVESENECNLSDILNHQNNHLHYRNQHPQPIQTQFDPTSVIISPAIISPALGHPNAQSSSSTTSSSSAAKFNRFSYQSSLNNNNLQAANIVIDEDEEYRYGSYGKNIINDNGAVAAPESQEEINAIELSFELPSPVQKPVKKMKNQNKKMQKLTVEGNSDTDDVDHDDDHVYGGRSDAAFRVINNNANGNQQQQQGYDFAPLNIDRDQKHTENTE